MTEAVINQNQQAQAFSPFGKRNANKDRIEQEEAELKELAEDKSNPQEPQDGDDSKNQHHQDVKPPRRHTVNFPFRNCKNIF